MPLGRPELLLGLGSRSRSKYRTSKAAHLVPVVVDSNHIRNQFLEVSGYSLDLVYELFLQMRVQACSKYYFLGLVVEPSCDRESLKVYPIHKGLLVVLS